MLVLRKKSLPKNLGPMLRSFPNVSLGKEESTLLSLLISAVFTKFRYPISLKKRICVELLSSFAKTSAAAFSSLPNKSSTQTPYLHSVSLAQAKKMIARTARSYFGMPKGANYNLREIRRIILKTASEMSIIEYYADFGSSRSSIA